MKVKNDPRSEFSNLSAVGNKQYIPRKRHFITDFLSDHLSFREKLSELQSLLYVPRGWITQYIFLASGKAKANE